ncbi:MAG TPA: DUF2341 domain-containing protein, partial [Chitinophagaceae bacterium]
MKKVPYKVNLILCFLFLFQDSKAQPPGYDYVKEIIIHESQIPDGPSLNNFPFLFSITDASLRTIANGGLVGNNNGYDIQFYLNSCSNKLDHQLETYDPVTGQVTAWIRLPALSTTTDTRIYLYFGNDTVSVSSSTTAVWDATYSGAWHFSDNPGAAAPQMQDGTSNGHHGTSFGSMTIANSVAGKMGRALSFDEVNDYIRIPDFLYGQELTVSFWFNASEVNGNSYQYVFSHGQWATQNSLNVYIGENSITTPGETHNLQVVKTVFRDNNDANNFDTLNAGNTWIDGNWHYYTMRIQDFGGASIYVDGILRVNYGVWGANTFNPPTDIFIGGREDLNPNRFFGGLLDEVRISTVWRTANWIRTEFNNQNDPASFFTIGFEGSAVSLCTPLPLRLTGFNATRSGSCVKLQWQTDDPTGSAATFLIERSENGIDWNTAGTVYNAYTFIDSFPYKGESFYRIKYSQGSVLYSSSVRKVESSCCDSEIRIYPNPSANGIFFMEFPGKEIPEQVTLLNHAGAFLQHIKLKKENNGINVLVPGKGL